MTEETQNLAETPEIQAEVPASEQAETAAPESDSSVPESKPAEATKTFTQEELDAIIGERLAKEKRKWARQQKVQAVERPASPPPPAEVPTVDQFESPEAYAEALAEQKAQQLIEQREAAKQQAAILDAYHEREEEARDRYADFEQVAYNPQLPVTQVMAQTIQASDIGPEIAYYLGSNPKEAERIARLSPFLQAKEIGKVEAKLANDPPVKKPSSAPAPIAPVTARGGQGRTLDTTDPRSIKEMSTSEWIEAERKRQIKKWEAQRLR
jgi:hypothetical protein